MEAAQAAAGRPAHAGVEGGAREIPGVPAAHGRPPEDHRRLAGIEIAPGMVTYIAGIVFLLACLLGVPLLKRLLHERAVRRLAMEGVTVVPTFWRPSGLRFRRPSW